VDAAAEALALAVAHPVLLARSTALLTPPVIAAAGNASLELTAWTLLRSCRLCQTWSTRRPHLARLVWSHLMHCSHTSSVCSALILATARMITIQDSQHHCVAAMASCKGLSARHLVCQQAAGHHPGTTLLMRHPPCTLRHRQRV
jgi:hypothetical protein